MTSVKLSLPYMMSIKLSLPWHECPQNLTFPAVTLLKPNPGAGGFLVERSTAPRIPPVPPEHHRRLLAARDLVLIMEDGRRRPGAYADRGFDVISPRWQRIMTSRQRRGQVLQGFREMNVENGAELCKLSHICLCECTDVQTFVQRIFKSFFV